MTRVISGFPGVGKSHFFKRARDKVVFDSDSSLFSWESPGVRHPDFPANYIQHIKSLMDEADVILVSTHKEVREALIEAGIRFTIVYPKREHKSEYLQRYKDRGSEDGFVALLEENWDAWISELDQETRCSRIELGGHQYLSSILRGD